MIFSVKIRFSQPLICKLIYIHKCVRPARIFINRILELFRANHDKERIRLTEDFFQDMAWFQKNLPAFNDIVLYKILMDDSYQNLHIDASLTGVGRVWRERVYATPTYTVQGFPMDIVLWKMMNILLAYRLWGK